VNYAAIVAGGGLGALLRYLSVQAALGVTGGVPAGFPFGTLFVNGAGAFVIGFLFNAFQTYAVPASLRLFLITGFLGGFTTFSTYSLETVQFLLSGNIRQGIMNFLLNNVLCFLLVTAGILLSKSLLK
jgi:CrcB protein